MVCTTISTTPTGTWNRTTTQNSDEPAHQAFRAQMGLHDKPQRTRLNSRFFQLQGWWNKVSNLHWMTIQGYSTSKDSTAHWRTEMACSSYKQRSQHCQREHTHSTEQGQIGMIGPTTTLTPQGPADTGYAGDYWQFNRKGELVRVHRQYRKTRFTPSRTQRPVPAEQLEDYRKRTIRFKDGTTNTFEDKYQTMGAPNRAQQQMWKGETAFRIKKGTTLPETL